MTIKKMQTPGYEAKRPYFTQLIFLLPFTTIIPIALEFFTEANGLTVADAITRGAHALFAHDRGLYFWLGLIASNLALVWFLKPVHLCWKGQEACSLQTRRDAQHAMMHLNNIGPFILSLQIGISVLITLLPRSETFQSDFFDSPILYMTLEAATTGLMIGVLIWVIVENSLFFARRNLMLSFPEIRPARASMYAKVFLIIAALVLFLVFQVFATTGYFFRKGIGFMAAAPKLAEDGLKMFELNQGGDVLKETLNVFYLRTGAFLFFVLELLWEIKIMMTKPLETIRTRLRAVNSGDTQGQREILVMHNDEYAEVYEEINKIIRTQQNQLTVSKGQLDSITDSAADPIIVYNEEGIISLFNPAAEKYFLCSAKEMLGTSVFSVFKGESLEKVHAESSHHDDLVRLSAYASDGTLRNFESHTTRVECGDQVEYTVVLRDISTHLELEANLMRAKHAAETANRMKSEFLATMSHELRTPLNAVLGFTQLLSSDKNLTPSQLDKIQTISRSGEHLLALINDILDISKIEAGKMEMHKTTFDLVQFVKDIQEMFELKCKKKGLNLYVENVGDLPRYVEGDLGKLRQVVINLVGNAVKFTAEGGIGIAVGRDGNLFRFSVTDSGRGIPENEIKQILEPFVQSSLTDNESGTGLGLAISSRFINMMGGTLEIQSEVGKGSVFSFTLVLSETDQVPEQDTPDAIPVAVKEGYAVPVLIVDDRNTNRLILKEMLEAVGFITIEAENGKEAFERCLEYKPHIVLMDIRMPIMDGYEAVKLIKGNALTAACSVFALTASAFRHDEEQILEAGFDGFLAKPFKRSALFRLIREKTKVELVYETVEPTQKQNVNPAALDYVHILSKLSDSEFETIHTSVLINDFAALANLAVLLSERLPDFASVLKDCAANFDEDGLGTVLTKLRSAHGNRG